MDREKKYAGMAFFKDLGEVYIMGLLYNTGYGVALVTKGKEMLYKNAIE